MILANLKTAAALGQSEVVLREGAELIVGGNLGDEVWSVLELVTIAAAELKSNQWTAYGLERLRKKFPNSRRVDLLMIRVREALGEFGEVDEMLVEGIEGHPEDVALRQRLITSHIERNDINRAIVMLTKHLTEFCGDLDSWRRLAGLYIQQGSLSKAAFCVDELFIHNPNCLSTQLAVVDCRSTLGEHQLARRAAASALLGHPTNLRAQWSYLLLAADGETKQIVKSELEEFYSRDSPSTSDLKINFSAKLSFVALRVLDAL